MPRFNYDLLRTRFRKWNNVIRFISNSTNPLFPTKVYIVLNSTCNMRCKMCDIGSRQEGGNLYKNLNKGLDMPFNSLKRLIDQFSNKRCLIIFNSTEPLLYSKIIDAIKYVRKKGQFCKIATNGYFVPELAEELVESNLNNLVISLDGPEKIHDSIRGVTGSHKRIVEGITKVMEYRKHRKLPYIKFNITISEFNQDHIFETINEIKHLKIEKIVFSHLNVVTEEMMNKHNKDVPFYKTNIKSSINPNNINPLNIYNQLRMVEKKFGHLNIIESPKLNKEQIIKYYKHPDKKLGFGRKCAFPWFSTQILVNGDVVPIMRCMNLILGNVFKQDIKEIWKGPEYTMLRKNLNQKKYFPACYRCCGIFPYFDLKNKY